MASQLEIDKVLDVLAAAYPRFSVSQATRDVYSGMLSPYLAEELRQAAKAAIARSTFFPSIAELCAFLPPAPRVSAGPAPEVSDETIRRIREDPLSNRSGTWERQPWGWLLPGMPEVAHG
jgi:hypothetical protein